MKELIQAGEFFNKLSEAQKKDLEEAVAEEIFFLEDDLQKKIISLLNDVDHRLGTNVRRRNDFTT